MIAFSGVRSSWLMFARNCDLCWLASASWRFASWSLLEEARVLDGDHGLIRERLEQRDLFCSERLNLMVTDQDAANRYAGTKERCSEQRAIAKYRLKRLRRPVFLL